MIIFLDSWDHYGIGYIGQKWHYVGTGFSVNTAVGVPRTGIGCLQLSTAGFSYCSYILNGVPSLATVGVAVKLGTLAAHEFLWLMYSTDGITVTPIIAVGTNGYGYLSLRGGVGYNIIATGGTRIMPGCWMYVELQCSGSVGKVNLNGQLDINYSGTIGSFDRVGLGCSVANNTTPGHFYDDFYLCDGTGSVNNSSFLGPIAVPNLLPSGPGNYTQWNAQATGNPGNNYTYVDDQSIDGEGTYLEAVAAGKLDSYNLYDLSGSPTVYGVQANAVARRTGPVGTAGTNLLLRIGSTNYTKGIYPLDSYSVLTGAYDQSPAGGNWTAAIINGMELGIAT